MRKAITAAILGMLLGSGAAAQEAERPPKPGRLIADALREGADRALMGDLDGLRSLPREIRKAAKQEARALAVSHVGDADLSELWRIKNLKRLMIESGALEDAASLVGCRELESLTLTRTRIKDLRSLARLERLKELTLVDTGIEDLAPFATLKGLKTLTIIGARQLDLGPLEPLIAKGLKVNID